MNSALESELERACQLLESGATEAMDDSAATLERVAIGLAASRDSMSVEEARRLRAAAQKARLLLNLAARFHSRWHDILSGMTGGYTSQGSPAALSSRTRVSVSG